VLELNISHFRRRLETLVAKVFREVDDGLTNSRGLRLADSNLETPSMATATSVAWAPISFRIRRTARR
jgi:hypothetical protein